MKKFNLIREAAEKRKGGKKELNRLLAAPLTSGQLKKITDDRYLAQMTRCVLMLVFIGELLRVNGLVLRKHFIGLI